MLDLSSNAIGARRSESMDQWYKTPNCPTVHIVRALEHNSTLMELRLSDNHLVGRQGEELEQVKAILHTLQPACVHAICLTIRFGSVTCAASLSLCDDTHGTSCCCLLYYFPMGINILTGIHMLAALQLTGAYQLLMV